MVQHIKAEREIALNQELNDYKIVPAAELKAWNLGTGLAIVDWLRQQGYEPEGLNL